MIEVKNLSKKFKIPRHRKLVLKDWVVSCWRGQLGTEKFYALREINFKVAAGETMGIVGANGSGKSTLLKLIAGILQPSAGSVKKIGRLTPFLELGVGFQGELTARENVYLYGAIMGLTRPQINKKFADIIDFAGIEQFVDVRLKNFSSGMHVRLAFSTAIQTEADIYLVDEVLAVGDVQFQKKCYQVFENFARQGKTILLVSHNLDLVRHFCKNTLLLEHGNQLVFGPTARAIDRYIYGGAGGGTVAEDGQNRWGSREVEIIRAELIDKNGRPNINFFGGEPLTIKIYYRVNKKVPEPIFGIGLYRKDGLYLFGTNTLLKGKKVGLKDQGVVVFRINRLPMAEGNFLISTTCHDLAGHNYDWHDKRYFFNLTRPTAEEGILTIEGDWEID
jgi:lipopolysaccharide transport system ATP-binding protein